MYISSFIIIYIIYRVGRIGNIEVDKMTISEMVKMITSQVDKMTTPIPNNKK